MYTVVLRKLATHCTHDGVNTISLCTWMVCGDGEDGFASSKTSCLISGQCGMLCHPLIVHVLTQVRNTSQCVRYIQSMDRHTCTYMPYEVVYYITQYSGRGKGLGKSDACDRRRVKMHVWIFN